MNTSPVKDAFWKALGSLAAVLVGWGSGLIVVAAFSLFFALRHETSWSEVLSGLGLYFFLIGGFAVPIWLLILLPLYVLLPRTSALWRVSICTVLGTCVGVVIMLAYLLIGGGLAALILWQLVVIAAVVGGITCFFGAMTADHFHYMRNGLINR